MSFDFNFTSSKLEKLIPRNREVSEWFDSLNTMLPKYQITSLVRVAHFISQCAYESHDFTRLEENLNYSEKALNRVFRRYFGEYPKKNAADYARNPEKIANYVYMDKYRKYKMGNIYDGDGWKFRGRGIKQLTGRDNYTRFGRTIGMSAEQVVDYIETKNGAIESACWFWDVNRLNSIADTGDVAKVTKVVNGGINGLDDRRRRYKIAIEVLEK